MTSLSNLGRMRGADKQCHAHYLDLYERYLSGRTIRSMLELGLAQGRSLLMWLDYFPDARIVGADHRHIHCDDARENPRCEIIICDQASTRLLQSGPYDFIVDDASHEALKTRQSLEVLWPSLNNGGLYVIEDLEVSYWERLVRQQCEWSGQRMDRRETEGWEEPNAIVPYLKSLADGLTARYANQRGHRFPELFGLKSICWHKNIVFLEKE